jgi:ribonuclease J
VNTSKGPVVYSGDLRMHGPRSDLTREFVDKARKSRPHAMLMEGTNMSKGADHSFTEEEVKQEIEKIISGAKGTVFTYFPSTNVDRFMTLFNAAVRNNRRLVVDTNLAYYIKSMRQKLPILPDLMADADIGVYFPPKKSCTFCADDYYYKDDKALLPKKVDYRDIRENPGRYVMHMSFNKLAELVHIKPEGADFIYSSSEHFYEGEDNEEQRRVWENWMEHFGIEFHKAHCSGHASKEDIANMIEAIDPEMLIPVHTNVPEEFKKLHGNVIIPEKGGTTAL